MGGVHDIPDEAEPDGLKESGEPRPGAEALLHLYPALSAGSDPVELEVAAE
jgi:hypothetical protein